MWRSDPTPAEYQAEQTKKELARGLDSVKPPKDLIDSTEYIYNHARSFRVFIWLLAISVSCLVSMLIHLYFKGVK
jgi:hypothetical protein